MKKYLVKKSSLEGSVHVPASKSHTLRAVLFAGLGCGKSVIYNYLPSPDTSSMCSALCLLGAKITIFSERMEVEGVSGKITFAEDVINAGNSGIVLRFCAAIAALSTYPVVITGDHSIRHQRPMKDLLNGIEQLGAKALSTKNDGYAPIIIQGPIHLKKALICGRDSQPVSALIIAAAFASCPITIEVKDPGEKPWVTLTLDWLKRLKIPFEAYGFEKYQLFGKAHYQGFQYTVPSDFSSAAFPVAAALVTNSEITLQNIDMSDVQGDKELINVFIRMGANIVVDEKNKVLHVKKGDKLSGITVDVNDFIDGITILAVVACFAEGVTHITNAKVARDKECDRIHAIATELKKMGAHIFEEEDGLKIAESTLKGSSHLHSYNDHRMVMSLAVAGMGAESESKISPIECVAKTYPSFCESFKAIHANIEEVL
ncbi:MAG: 3-phosphoshikimate 1-carboxyvinyltransferase [Chlamydiales bacterium]|nr:3-phosphoshikimate 1-carboxyvinyltransferase [Chlamydiales bacterium]